MVELARCMDGVGEVITWGENAPTEPPCWDAQFELQEMPYFFRTMLEELPVVERYIKLPESAARLAARIVGDSTAPHVGVVWSASDWDPARSILLPQLRPVLRGSGCQFWNLQGGAPRKYWKELQSSPSLCDAPELDTGGLVSFAAMIAQMDLVISVDTLAAHLAGALGVPAWVILQKTADWRWMIDRDDSPWYPSVRLFRQSRQGEWTDAILKIQAALQEFIAKFSQDRMVA
jgi:hypothetical protein